MAKSAVSPLRTAIVAACLLITQVFAASAVLGVDLGTEYIKAALVKPGIPLEIVLTKDSRRKEASAVAFKPLQNGAAKDTFPERAYGSDAMALSARYPGDVFPNLKAVLGLTVDSEPVKEYALRHPALQMVTHSLRNTVTFKSKEGFTADEDAWMVEELLAMELQSIQKNAEALAGSGTIVKSVVLTVPPFYTIEEKRAVEMAAELAGLKVLALISDGMAVGVNYATNRQFPSVSKGEKPEYHMVFDMGAGSTKATVLKMQSRDIKDVGKFNKTIQEVQVMGSGWDRTLGGDALNAAILDDMIRKFVDSSAAKAASVTLEGVRGHGRAIAKMSKEAERLRHVLSANQNTQTSFEGLYDDVNFKYKITRADFETMVEESAGRVTVAVEKALEISGLTVKDLESVILYGGATRTPFVQKQLEKIFGTGDKLRSNVNADEAAVFGAGFRAAELSPSFRVKEIRIAEGAAYPAGLKWTNEKGKVQQQRIWTATSQLGAAAKELSFGNKEDFSLESYQQVPAPANDVTPGVTEKVTNVIETKNLTATIAHMKEEYSCEPSAVQLKMSLRLASENGEVEVVKAYVECEAEVVEKETFVDGVKNMFGFGKKDQKPLKGDESASSVEDDATTSSEAAESTSSEADATSDASTTTTSTTISLASPSAEPKKTRKMVAVPIKIEVTKAGMPQLDKVSSLASKDRLRAFEASDRARRAREDTLNQLEGFTYKIRDLLDSETFITASTETERTKLEQGSSDASEWLYGEGADATRDALKKKLKSLQDIVVPIQERIEEGTKRPELLASLEESLTKSLDFVKGIKDKIAEHEAWAASKSASASSSQPTPAPSADDFADLEDNDSTTKKKPSMADFKEELGPVPLLYTAEDIVETETLHAATAKWLEERLAEQAKLSATDNPVLLIKDITSKRDKLDQAVRELAMKAVKNFEKRQAKGKKTAKSAKPKKVKATTAKSADDASGTDQPWDPENVMTFNADDFMGDGDMPGQEKLEEMIRQARAKQGKKAGGTTHDEL